jgi:hypothetical protein
MCSLSPQFKIPAKSMAFNPSIAVCGVTPFVPRSSVDCKLASEPFRCGALVHTLWRQQNSPHVPRQDSRSSALKPKHLTGRRLIPDHSKYLGLYGAIEPALSTRDLRGSYDQRDGTSSAGPHRDRCWTCSNLDETGGSGPGGPYRVENLLILGPEHFREAVVGRRSADQGALTSELLN